MFVLKHYSVTTYAFAATPKCATLKSVCVEIFCIIILTKSQFKPSHIDEADFTIGTQVAITCVVSLSVLIILYVCDLFKYALIIPG
jgi:hypothetical protein